MNTLIGFVCISFSQTNLNFNFFVVKVDNIYFQSTGGGICFGGGEPTLYKDFIVEFKKICGDKWKITLETCLRCSYNTIKDLSPVVDHWIVDVKSMNHS